MKIKYLVTVRDKETQELKDVVYVAAMNEKGCAKQLKGRFRNYSFFPVELDDIKNGESVIK